MWLFLCCIICHYGNKLTFIATRYLVDIKSSRFSSRWPLCKEDTCYLEKIE